MLKELMSNPYVSAILAFCTIFSVVYGVWWNKKSKCKKEFSCYRNSYRVVRAGKSFIPELELKYKGTEIQELVVTKYAIWNSGNMMLHESDIVEEKSLQIVGDEKTSHILDAKIIQCSDEDNKFNIEKSVDGNVKLSFDYVNVKDGIVVQIVHTGEAKDIKVSCKIKGGKPVRSYNVDKEPKIGRRFGNGIIVGVWTFFTVLILLMLVLATIVSFGAGLSSVENILTVCIFGVYSVVMIIMYHKLLKEVCHINIPIRIRNAIEYDELDK